MTPLGIRSREALETLAAQPVWNDEVWKHCYELVSANMNDALVAYVHDDLIHCSATSLFSFRNPPRHPDFDNYKQESRDVAKTLKDLDVARGSAEEVRFLR